MRITTLGVCQDGMKEVWDTKLLVEISITVINLSQVKLKVKRSIKNKNSFKTVFTSI